MSLAFFAEMAIKSAVIAAIGLMFAALLKYRAAADRAAVLRLAIGLVLLLPIVSAFLPALQVEVAAAPALEPAPAPSVAASIASAVPTAGEAAPAGVFNDPGILVAIAYLGGLLMALARLIVGLWTLVRWTRNAEPLDCLEWTSVFDRVRRETGLTPKARLLLSNEAPAPLSWGWSSPVILIDPDTARRQEDARAIVEHEAAHIVRNDWPALLVARVASAIFWFNPLVWALERSLVQNTEEAADNCAVGRVEPARYAQTLLGCANQLCRSALPANSMSGSAAIGRRVKAILDVRFRETPSGSALAMIAMGLCVAFAGPVSAMKLVAATISAPVPAEVRAAVAKPAARVTAAVTAAVGAEAIGEAVAAEVEAAVETALAETSIPVPPAAPAPVALAAVPAYIATPVPPISPAPPAPLAMAAPPAPPAPRMMAAPPAPPAPPAGLLDVDALVNMQIHGVSGRFISDMAQAGYPRLSVDELVAMRIHGVDAEDARRAAAEAGRRLSPDELVSLAIHGRIVEAKRRTRR